MWRILYWVIIVEQTAALAAAEPVRLTFDGRHKQSPIFLPDGEEIIFTTKISSPHLALGRLKLSDKTVTRLHPTAGLPEMKATFTADGKQFTFLELTGNDTVALHLTDLKRTAEKILTFSKPIPWDPVILPDGSGVLASLDGQIVKKQRDADDETALTASAGLNNWPDVSRDGRKIVFSSSRDGNYEIYSMNIDGTSLLRLTETPALEAHPAWSPDGSRVALTSTRDGNYDIYVIDADGAHPRRVTDHLERDDFAAWHPSGDKLVIVSERDGRQDLYLVDVPE